MKQGFNKHIFLILIVLVVITSCKKKTLDEQYVGTWKSASVTINLKSDATGTYDFYVSVGPVSSNESSTGKVVIEGDKMTIGKKTLSIKAYPTEVEIYAGEFNTFMVLDNDTLYKQPVVATRCFNGVKDGNEIGIDCGGNCKVCETCSDGIRNQTESGVDCGGECAPCPTCNDGKMNQNETGIDCGGNCGSCISTCTVPLGFGEYYYPGSSPSSYTVGVGAVDSISENRPFPEITAYFGTFSGYSSYKITLYGKSFIKMPVNSTELFVTDYQYDSFRPKKMCILTANSKLNGQKLAVRSNYVYIKKLASNSYNIKFSDIKTTDKFQNDSSRISLNVNFNF